MLNKHVLAHAKLCVSMVTCVQSNAAEERTSVRIPSFTGQLPITSIAATSSSGAPWQFPSLMDLKELHISPSVLTSHAYYVSRTMLGAVYLKLWPRRDPCPWEAHSLASKVETAQLLAMQFDKCSNNIMLFMEAQGKADWVGWNRKAWEHEEALERQ